MFCSQCGSQLPDAAAFCPSCGAPISKDQTPPEHDVMINPLIEKDTQDSTVQNNPLKPPIQDGSQIPSVQHGTIEPPKPGFNKRKKILIIAIAAVIVLLGFFAAIASIFFPRDFLIFFLGEERYTRTMFSGVAEGVTGHLLDQFSEIFEDGINIETGELMYSLSFEAESGTARRLANDLAFFDDDAISILELLTASSIDISANFDISEQNPLLNLSASWNLTGADSSTEEFLNLDSLVVGDSIYLRIRQLLSRYIGINLGDLGLDLSDIGDFANAFEQFQIFGISPDNLERLSNFIDDNEREIDAMISDVIGVFFSSFDDMRVDRNVSVAIGEELINHHKAVITADDEDVLLASIEVLELIKGNEDYTSLIFDAMWIIDPAFDLTRREFLDYLDNIIENLEEETDLHGDNGEEVDIFLYIGRRNNIAGFGISPQNDDGSLSFVMINNVGYEIAIEIDDTYVRLHGFLDSTRRSTTGDINIIARLPDYVLGNIAWQGEDIVLEGKLLDFEFSSDFVGVNIYGSNIMELIDDNAQLNAQTIDLVNNLVLDVLLTYSDNESSAEINLRHMQPEIRLAFSSRHRELDYVSIDPPQSADVLYLDLPALMSGDLFALLPHFSAVLEVYSNLYEFTENLDRMGFDVGRMLEELLGEFFQGLF